MNNAHPSLIDMLDDAPARIEALTAKLTDAQLRARPADAEWSIAQIFAHVRASDDILAYRLYLILCADMPRYDSLDERRWETLVGYEQLDFAASLRAFAARRAELTAMLRRAAPAAFGRIGVHSTRGDQTLEAVAIALAEHEQEHLAQIAALAGSA